MTVPGHGKPPIARPLRREVLRLFLTAKYSACLATAFLGSFKLPVRYSDHKYLIAILTGLSLAELPNPLTHRQSLLGDGICREHNLALLIPFLVQFSTRMETLNLRDETVIVLHDQEHNIVMPTQV